MPKKFAKTIAAKKADTKSFQLRWKSVNVFVSTQKRTKADENVHRIFPSSQHINNAKIDKQ